jgi:hypothetical protein
MGLWVNEVIGDQVMVKTVKIPYNDKIEIV